MKQKDIILIVVIVFVSGILSYFISTKLFSSSQQKSVEVKTVDGITTQFVQPSNLYFNDSRSVNPTQTIVIGPPKQ